MDEFKKEFKKNFLNNINSGDCFRVFHGRGKAFLRYEQINIDFFSPYFVVWNFSKEENPLIEPIKEYLNLLLDKNIKGYFVKNLGKIEFFGEFKKIEMATELGIKYGIDLETNQNIGLFLDMKNTRKFLMNYSQNKIILNLFSYTCSLSLAALKGGALKVINVDMNKGVLEKGRNNHILNEMLSNKVEFCKKDILKSWNFLRKKGPYDLIIIDPPTAQGDSFKVERDYVKVLKKVDDMLNPHGELLLCLNSPFLGMNYLEDLMMTNLPHFHKESNLDIPLEFKEIGPLKALKVALFRRIDEAL